MAEQEVIVMNPEEEVESSQPSSRVLGVLNVALQVYINKQRGEEQKKEKSRD